MVRCMIRYSAILSYMKRIAVHRRGIDWIIVLCVVTLVGWGLSLLYDPAIGVDGLFEKQLISVGIAAIVAYGLSFIDYRFLRHSMTVMVLYVGMIALLVSLFAIGSVFSGARSWLDFGTFALQPAEFAKVVLILVLAKYFSKRHKEIANIKHIIITGVYALILFVLVAVQPDFGSAVILFSIWFGMVLLAGLNWRHLMLLVGSGIVAVVLLWTFVFADYQKQRIQTFLDPGLDPRGAGYNITQATIAIGSGGIAGKGVGNGSQSRLSFLPQYQTDFVFASFAEEWGFIGTIILFAVYGLLIGRILWIGIKGDSNFEILFAGGVAIYFITHTLIHTGINIGILPVTGTTIPFMSYGGSHLLAEMAALGILFGMNRYSRTVHHGAMSHEFSGSEHAIAREFQ